MNNFWELKQAATPKTIELYIYSDVKADDYDWWTGEKLESETSANYFREELARAGELDNINIYINSLGGSVFEGVAIYNQLRRHKAYKTVYIDGFACSVAAVIAMAGDKIIMPRNTNMMIHNAWAYTAGNAEQLRKSADDLDIINQSSRQAFLLKAGDKLTEEKLKELMDAESYLTAMSCVEYGLADEFASTEADMQAARNMLKQAQQSAFVGQRLNTWAASALQLPQEPPQQEPPPQEQQQELQQQTLPKEPTTGAGIAMMTAFLKSIGGV